MNNCHDDTDYCDTLVKTPFFLLLQLMTPLRVCRETRSTVNASLSTVRRTEAAVRALLPLSAVAAALAVAAVALATYHCWLATAAATAPLLLLQPQRRCNCCC
jgi:hypothetical protein